MGCNETNYPKGNTMFTEDTIDRINPFFVADRKKDKLKKNRNKIVAVTLIAGAVAVNVAAYQKLSNSEHSAPKDNSADI